MADTLLRQAAQTMHDTNLIGRWNYYSGNHPAVYVTPKLRELFRNLADSMVENYCSLAIDARLNRLQITGWGGDSSNLATGIWEANGLERLQDRLFRWALVHGRAVIITDPATRSISINPADRATVITDPDDITRTLAVAKRYSRDPRPENRATAEPGDWYTLTTDTTTTLHRARDGRWATISETRNTLGYVPAVEVRPYSDGPCLIDIIAPVQDRINKLGANKMVTAEFGAFRQRAFITRQPLPPDTVRQQPDHAIVLDPGEPDSPTRIHEFQPTDLTNYDHARNSEIDSLFTLAAIPRHMRMNPGAAPSGAAILADEGPLLEAIETHQKEFGTALSQAMDMLGARGAEPTWRDPAPNDDLLNAQRFGLLVSGGLPWPTAARRALSMPEDEIMRAIEESAPTGDATGAMLLASAERLANAQLTE